MRKKVGGEKGAGRPKGRRAIVVLALLGGLLSGGGPADGQSRERERARERERTEDHHPRGLILVPLEEMEWRPHPALPPGAEVSVLRGNPDTGSFVAYLYFPDKYVVPMHHHPALEDVTVLRGMVWLTHPGRAARPVREGDFVATPAGMPHSVRCASKGGCIVSLSSDQAFGIVYENPEDDPRRSRPGAP